METAGAKLSEMYGTSVRRSYGERDGVDVRAQTLGLVE